MDQQLLSLPGYALRRAASAAGAELTSRLAPLGLKQASATILLLLDANPCVTASALGRALDIQRANMVPLLKQLEETGLVSRTPIDGKSQALELTHKGREILGEVLKIVDSFESDLLARIPAEHRAHVLPALNAIWRD